MIPATQVPFILVLASITLAIAWIDARTMRIPNGLNALLASCGLMYVIAFSRDEMPVQILFACFVFGALTLFGHAFFRATGQIGLGFGDVKMFGASAIWISPANFPILLLVSSLSAILYLTLADGINNLRAGGRRLPFGPFIAAALLITWIWQET